MWKCVGTILWECFDYTSLKNVVTHNSCNTTSILGCFAVAVVVAIVAFIRSFYRIEFLRRSCMRMSVLYFNFYLKAISRFIAGWHKFSQYAYEVNLQFIRKIYLFILFSLAFSLSSFEYISSVNTWWWCLSVFNVDSNVNKFRCERASARPFKRSNLLSLHKALRKWRRRFCWGFWVKFKANICDSKNNIETIYTSHIYIYIWCCLHCQNGTRELAHAALRKRMHDLCWL